MSRRISKGENLWTKTKLDKSDHVTPSKFTFHYPLCHINNYYYYFFFYEKGWISLAKKKKGWILFPFLEAFDCGHTKWGRGVGPRRRVREWRKMSGWIRVELSLVCDIASLPSVGNGNRENGVLNFSLSVGPTVFPTWDPPTYIRVHASFHFPFSFN